MPYQKNCVPSVAINEGMPILATSTPLMKPMRTPANSATTTPPQRMSSAASGEARNPPSGVSVADTIQSCPSLKMIASTKPEKPMTAGKLRSISPAPMMKVSPIASSITGGRVERNVVYWNGRRKTSGARYMNSNRMTMKTTMIGRPSTRWKIDAFSGRAIGSRLRSASATARDIRSGRRPTCPSA